MRIFVLVNDGSPRRVTMKSIWGDNAQVGIGGAELALLTMCEAWHNAGHEVVLFNDPRETNASPFEQRAISDYHANDPCDVVIAFRSPNLRLFKSPAKRIWWSCDQFTVGNFKEFRQMVDKVVCISKYHSDYFTMSYGIADAIVIDLPVRVQDYEGKNIEKIKNHFIFTSVPARGLDIMLRFWPNILKEIPDATLTITSDYRLWGEELGMGNEQFISQARPLPNITFLSAVPRARLIEEQLKAEITMYPCTYDELFCIAIAEAQVSGSYTITSDCGALITTNMGIVIPGDPKGQVNEYCIKASQFANAHDDGTVKYITKKAIKRFHPNTILSEWDKKVFNG